MFLKALSLSKNSGAASPASPSSENANNEAAYMAWAETTLTVSVTRGDLMSKPGGGKASHQGYETQMRLKNAPVAAIELPVCFKIH
jgi:hypothetical protein